MSVLLIPHALDFYAMNSAKLRVCVQIFHMADIAQQLFCVVLGKALLPPIFVVFGPNFGSNGNGGKLTDCHVVLLFGKDYGIFSRGGQAPGPALFSVTVNYLLPFIYAVLFVTYRFRPLV